jgi:hypothetical protein
MRFNINYTGKSSTSVLDAAVGLGVGLAVPTVAERLLAMPALASLPMVAGNERYWAAGIGAVASLGLAYVRGMGAATVAFVAAILYGIGGLIQDHILEPLLTAAQAALPMGGGAADNTGLLTARQLGMLTASVQDTGRLVVESGMRGAVGAGNLSAFGSVGF